MVKRLVMAVGILALVASSGVAQAQSVCTGNKIKAAGKKAASKLTCLSKGVGKGLATDSTCLAKAEVKFSSTVAKAEAKTYTGPGCVTTGDRPAIEAKVDALLSDVDDLVNVPVLPGSKCDGDKVKAAGKKAAAKLTCYSKAATKALPLDSTCIAKAEVKFSSAAAKADAKGAACTATGDADAYETLVDAAVDDVIAELQLECRKIVPDTAIANTYKQLSVAGPKLCGPTSPTVSMRFQPCNANTDCGGAAMSNQCFPTPWVQLGFFAPQATPVGTETTFTVTPGTYPACEHTACVKCGNPSADCTEIKPGCDANVGCFTTACCDDPGFKLPALIVAGVGVCTRSFQTSCGAGVVDTSKPQTGDNEVTKQGDTSDPGPNCIEGDGDDPAPLACNTAGEGADKKGKIVRTLGAGGPDVDGVHFRLLTPSVSTSWTDLDGCTPTATFDADEFLFSQMPMNTESSTAGATGEFVDLDGDTCKFAGSGFGTNMAGPVTVPSPPAAPAPYGSGGGTVTVAAGPIFSGTSPVFDVGFASVSPNSKLTIEPNAACSCSITPGCPE